ncbi:MULTISPECIES: DUF2905 family protein [Methylococcus]|jgi:hypothetical protein|uniref:Uncharacterized membrane protein YrzS n=1 Tax=Methylococcus capsulatus TaxID=414 RepID=A0AA35UT67_METCP|nr:DUF2905 family protein [Methylococcus capsulatus]QXP90866.1 DUF2905 domain-containing protein [Methylococcus capsulatus]CAI8881768.1 putative Uncharacterized membrane protein YrzS [Methylococcus capsulatus]
MSLAKLLIVVGLGIAALGALLHLAPGLLGWFGRLPGDIRLGDENRYVFIPITSMIVISLIISLILNLFFRR